jgi:hypothetical protein
MLDAQEAFTNVWRFVGLQNIVPLCFDDAAETQGIPHAQATATLREVSGYAGGQVNKITIDVQVRLVQGAAVRRVVEEKMSRMHRYGRARTRISEFKRTQARIQRDSTGRYAGKAVELAPYAWELWIDEVTTGL